MELKDNGRGKGNKDRSRKEELTKERESAEDGKLVDFWFPTAPGLLLLPLCFWNADVPTAFRECVQRHLFPRHVCVSA